MTRLVSGLLFILLCWLCLGMAVPEKKLWSRWAIFDPDATATIDYSGWQSFLDQYVTINLNGVSLVNYKAVTPEDAQKLKQTIVSLARIPIDHYNRNEQLAFWINLYNALTIDIVLDHYPVKSIRQIKLSGWLVPGPWQAKVIQVAGIPLSLNDIENRILRPIWQDPRIHYAINCATYSCPSLQKTAFTGSNIEQLMDAGARQYVNSPRGVTIANGNRLIVSSIYVWYQLDFGGSDAGVIAHLKQYAKPALKRRLETINHISEDYFNWALNTNLR